MKDELLEIKNELKNDFKNIISKEVAEEIKRIESKVIEKNVYSTYSPTYYDRRREEGGLSDTNNMQADYKVTKDGIQVEVINITKGNNTYSGSTNGYIQDIIEDGVGYWNKSLDERIGARPFIEETQNEVDKEIESLVENELKKLGYY